MRQENEEKDKLVIDLQIQVENKNQVISDEFLLKEATNLKAESVLNEKIIELYNSQNTHNNFLCLKSFLCKL